MVNQSALLGTPSSSVMTRQDERFEVDPNLHPTIVATCEEHMKSMWLVANWRACVCIGEQYFVKFGSSREMESERLTRDYLFDYAQRFPGAEDGICPPRIAKILTHFIDDCTMYLIMEYIRLQESPLDLDVRIHKAVLWLSRAPLPPNQMLGPVGGGRIRHRFFKDHEAPFPIPDLATLDQYIQKAYNCLHPSGRKIIPPFSVLGERIMFTQSDMDKSNFGVDEHGNTVMMDFQHVGVLPETFVALTLGAYDATLESLGLSDNPNGYCMAAIRANLWMCANPSLGMKGGNSR